MYIYDIPHYYPKFNVLTVLKSQGSVNFPACLWHLVLTYHTNIQGLQRSAGPRYEMLWAEIDAVRNRFFSSKILRLLHKYKKHNEVPKHSETTPNQTQLSERICPNHQIAPYYKKKHISRMVQMIFRYLPGLLYGFHCLHAAGCEPETFTKEICPSKIDIYLTRNEAKKVRMI